VWLCTTFWGGGGGVAAATTLKATRYPASRVCKTANLPARSTVHQPGTSPSLFSSTMATTSSREARDHPFYRVRGLASKLVRHPSSYLSHDDLTTMGIEVAAMDIKTGTPADSGPQFCDLYPCREFDAMFETVPVQWPPLKKRGVYYAALQIMQIIESSLSDGGLASQSKYVWRR
jgi:hypothetical protein